MTPHRERQVIKTLRADIRWAVRNAGGFAPDRAADEMLDRCVVKKHRGKLCGVCAIGARAVRVGKAAANPVDYYDQVVDQVEIAARSLKISETEASTIFAAIASEHTPESLTNDPIDRALGMAWRLRQYGLGLMAKKTRRTRK